MITQALNVKLNSFANQFLYLIERIPNHTQPGKIWDVRSPSVG